MKDLFSPSDLDECWSRKEITDYVNAKVREWLSQAPVEDWSLLPSNKNYLISSFGRVFSIRRNKFMKPQKNKKINPYLACMISAGQKTKFRTIHRLVMESFVGPCPAGMCVAHMNDDKFDNRLENLSYVTPKENSSHMVNRGRSHVGTKNHRARLSENDVREIKKLLRDTKKSYKCIANMFGVTEKTIYSIKHKKRWNHVEVDNG